MLKSILERLEVKLRAELRQCLEVWCKMAGSCGRVESILCKVRQLFIMTVRLGCAIV